MRRIDVAGRAGWARSLGMLLVSALLAGAGCAAGTADIPSDRAISALIGPVVSVEAASLRLPPGSPQLPALLADPEGWQPDAAQEGLSRSDTRFEFDADGWLRGSILGWDEDRGWKLHMVFGEDGATPPLAARAWLRPPEGSGQPDWPMGEGKLRYAGAERTMDYRGQRPGVEGRERLERRLVVAASGFVAREETTNVAPDGTTVHWYRQSLERDAQGRPVDDAELLEGVDYRVSSQYFLPDGQGNPRRIVRLYRAADAAQDAPVLRAEVTLRTLRYHDETR